MLDRALAARLPHVHEQQELEEAANVRAAGLGPRLGLDLRDFGDGVTAVRTAQMPTHGPGNQVVGPTDAVLARLDAVSAWFDDAKCSLRVRVPAADLDARLGRRLAGCGFAVQEVEAWLAAPIAELRTEARPHDIRRVRTAADNAAFRTAFFEGWELSDPTVREVAGAAMAPDEDPPAWRRYIAHVDGAPAAEAVLRVESGLAYLAEAATVPAFRRRGLQRALIAHRLQRAREEGATVAFGAVQYGDGSWANMRGMGLREEQITVSLTRPPAG